jgi:protein-S-isoprenylcysteine O-methyltransferase Ste14
MYSYFIISILCLIIILPIYFLSLEHLKLQHRFGEKKGRKIGDILGMISGWGFFLFLGSLWISPQPKYIIPFWENNLLTVPLFNFVIPLTHVIIFTLCIIPTIYLSFSAIKNLSLKVAETHRPVKVINSGTYTIIRHPQYVGAFMAHIGISFLLSAFYSLLVTPFIAIYIYLISKKEEKELQKEFANYIDYLNSVPMFIPNLRFKKKL